MREKQFEVSYFSSISESAKELSRHQVVFSHVAYVTGGSSYKHPLKIPAIAATAGHPGRVQVLRCEDVSDTL